MTRRAVVWAATLLSAGIGPSAIAGESATLTFGRAEKSAAVEVARTATERRRGLSGRDTPGAMLFVFRPPERACLWMNNVRFALTAAFINGDGEVVDIRDMAANTRVLHCADNAISFALEAAPDFFRTHQITVGTVVGGLEGL